MAINIDRQLFENLSPLEILAKQVVEGFITGLHKSPFHGFSVEFAEHRLYNTGESTRHIDWKLYARSEKLFTKRFDEETNLRCQLIIDTSSSMCFPESQNTGLKELNKLGFSIYAAAAIMHLLKKQRDAFGLSLFDEEISFHSLAKSSMTHYRFLLSELEKMLNNPNQLKKTDTVDALHQIAEKIHRRSLVAVFSDMMDNMGRREEMFQALQHLKHNGHEVILFHVTDKKLEFDFEFENRPYTFIDLETGTEIKAHPKEIKDTYLNLISKFNKELRIKCGQYRIDFVEADINQGFNHVLLEYLIKRSKMM
jgi:uncharacterized protein (DUF58 family)